MSEKLLTNPTRRSFIGTAGALTLGGIAVAADTPLAPPDRQPPDLKLPEPPIKPVGYAIVGLGTLALEEILPAFALCKRSKPVALVSGHPDKARKVAAAYGIDPKAIYNYSNYDSLAQNPAVEVIYIVLPNSMHAEYTVRGLRAGKHVLCEKPMADSPAECEKMIAAAREANRQLMIAYRLHYEPFNLKAMEVCRSGKIGKVKTITASNGQTQKAPNIRLSKELGGGPLQDVGVYCLNAARYLTGEEPVEVTGFSNQPADDPRFREVPESVSFTLKFPGGALASCDCSFGTSVVRQYTAVGTKGSLFMDNAFGYNGQRLSVSTPEGDAEKPITPGNHFALEMDHFSECVATGKPNRTPGQEGLADLKVMAAINEAIRTGQRVRV